jgi:uncharacterized phiE125 gp8 family phage protein
MTYALITPPIAEALSLADVKAHLRIDNPDEDELLESLIRTAREHLERVSGLALISQGLRLYLDAWPEDGIVPIARGPVQAVVEIRVFDAVGDETPVSLDGHVLDGDARPARLFLRNRPIPGEPLNGIEIDFTAGFGDAGLDVPDTLKRAMLTHIAAMHEFRGAVTPADQPAVIPEGYDRLIAPFLIRRL